jgi:predicted RNase H-like HicB family nuclease
MSDVARRYPAKIFWSAEDEGFIATAPDLPGCSAFGEDRSEALLQLEDAIDAWIEAAIAAGNPVPEPSRPVVESQSSGKLLVRMPRSLHADLAEAAKRENVSLNHYVVFLLTMATTYRTAARDRYYHVQVSTVGGARVVAVQQGIVTQVASTFFGASSGSMLTGMASTNG